MSSRIVWSEGLFVKPQHFQEQFSHIESEIYNRINYLIPYPFGMIDFEINQEQLSLGKISLSFAKGIFKDGTVFDAPNVDILPDALDTKDAKGTLSHKILYLAIPLKVAGGCEYAEDHASFQNSSARFLTFPHTVKDVTAQDGGITEIITGKIKLRLMLESDDMSNFDAIPIAKILEKQADGTIILDNQYISCSINSKRISRLSRFINDLAESLSQRAEDLAGKMGDPEHSDVASVTDFMLLQMLNRWSPIFHHLNASPKLHPMNLYESLIQLCGEISTFTSESRRPMHLPSYYHEDLEKSFSPLIMQIRQNLSAVLQPNAIAISLRKIRDTLYTAAISDRQVIDKYEFILAVSADVLSDKLRTEFPAQTKIASTEKIRELVNLHLPGISIQALPIAPRQLPYHAGYIYFQLAQSSTAWADMREASGFAIHTSGHFPQLKMQLWAIKK